MGRMKRIREAAEARNEGARSSVSSPSGSRLPRQARRVTHLPAPYSFYSSHSWIHFLSRGGAVSNTGPAQPDGELRGGAAGEFTARLPATRTRHSPLMKNYLLDMDGVL